MDPKQLVQLLILAHLAGIHRGHTVGHALGSQQAQQPQPKPGNPQARQPQGMAPKRTPQQQGHRGLGQGFHGGKGPVTGGLGSMQNALGAHPHQQQAQNPMMMALQAFGAKKP